MTGRYILYGSKLAKYSMAGFYTGMWQYDSRPSSLQNYDACLSFPFRYNPFFTLNLKGTNIFACNSP